MSADSPSRRLRQALAQCNDLNVLDGIPPRMVQHSSMGSANAQSRRPQSDCDIVTITTHAASTDDTAESSQDAHTSAEQSPNPESDLPAHFPLQKIDSNSSRASSTSASPSILSPCIATSTSTFLKPGAKFLGSQRSEKSQYGVVVQIQYVDMAESFLCGYLSIRGLTEEHPTLTTYFEGEMIGAKHSFMTSNPEWGANEGSRH